MERPRLERSYSARLRALVEIEFEPAAPVGGLEAEQCGSSNIGKTGNFAGTEHDRTEGVPQGVPWAWQTSIAVFHCGRATSRLIAIA